MASEGARPPIWRLIELAAEEISAPISIQQILDWIATEYPDVAPNTVRTQVAGLTGNLQSYLNHPVFSQRDPILWNVGYGLYEPYEQSRHGDPAPTAEPDLTVEPLVEVSRPPVWQLLAQASRELVPPFSSQDVVDWFARHYPDIRDNTIRTQMSDWAGNSPAYMFNPAYNTRPPVLWRVARG
jgi:hypothetical protein